MVKEDNNWIDVEIMDTEYIPIETESRAPLFHDGFNFYPISERYYKTIVVPEKHLVHFKYDNKNWSIDNVNLFNKIKTSDINIGDSIKLKEIKGWNKKSDLIVHYFDYEI
ncbi:hypothetical protein [Alkaliphilus sp. B6464]|uniref:hypothetical protein n=1 Tax=Alkaliphilus sp. B6464 TaxID=2731219 RepID=UPI001BAD7596|nr:hypothetical protein [Alkaliphilus sp. B6464]QUH22060.1 hypothetical protein HYG84_19330 [Alkaliphilus sp. B6464]